MSYDDVVDWPREHRLRHGARRNTELPGRETYGGRGEENSAGEGRWGTEQPNEGLFLKLIHCSYLNWLLKHITIGFKILEQVLENRTKDSKLEMEVLENLQELKELNQRQALVDFEGMIDQYREMEKREREREKEEDEREMKWVMNVQKNGQ